MFIWQSQLSPVCLNIWSFNWSNFSLRLHVLIAQNVTVNVLLTLEIGQLINHELKADVQLQTQLFIWKHMFVKNGYLLLSVLEIFPTIFGGDTQLYKGRWLLKRSRRQQQSHLFLSQNMILQSEWPLARSGFSFLSTGTVTLSWVAEKTCLASLPGKY